MINGSPISISSQQRLLRDGSLVSTKDIKLPDLLDGKGQVEEQTLLQVEFVNEKLERKALRSQLANKNTFLTRVWQLALATGLVLVALAAGVGGLAYWISVPKEINQPFLLYGESCYVNSRSCDATRMLWCPAGTCVCLGTFSWNATGQNCSCAANQLWNGISCQNLGKYGDPCTGPSSCDVNLMCVTVLNQTLSTGQSICACDNATYLYTGNNTCLPRLPYMEDCKTKFDCQDWLGLECSNYSSSIKCQCKSPSYWNGSICTQPALGWEACSGSIPCSTDRGLTCSPSNICECDSLYYWDNVTTIWCQQKKTYSIPCEYDFQCNTTVGLSCPTNVSTGCNCPATSYTGICDCQEGKFWDGQRCINQHIHNGTCPGQYACTSNLVCHLGHCICPGNMIWNGPSILNCSCPGSTVWNSVTNNCE